VKHSLLIHTLPPRSPSVSPLVNATALNFASLAQAWYNDF